MTFSSERLFVVLCAGFVTALVIADIVGSKLIATPEITFQLPDWLAQLAGQPQWVIPSLVMSAGIIPFPLTFVLTDLINEFYGKKGARFVTFVGLGMAIFAVGLLSITRVIPATPNSPIPHQAFEAVFGLSGRMFLASLTAYLIGQFLDIQVFHTLRRLTKEKMLWLRTTGSTVMSQLMDSLVVTFVAFSGKLAFIDITHIAMNNYGVKFLIALSLTPICYLGHSIIVSLLGYHPSSRYQAGHSLPAEISAEPDNLAV